MTVTTETLPSLVEIGPADCWLWTGRIHRGYGVVRLNRKNGMAHRVVYELLVGPIPEGLELDHLCRNRPCCNPDHLEPVTRSENARRSPLRVGTHCKHGHALTEDNLCPSGNREHPNRRSCLICYRRRWRLRAARQKAARS